MFEFVRSFFARSERPIVNKIVRASYDAAKVGGPDSNHWRYANAESADKLNTPEVRQRIRNRARYERRNNSVLDGIVDTLANDTIGTGPRPQLAIPGADPLAANSVEKQFLRWCLHTGLASKLRTARKAKCSDGEAVLLKVNNPRSRNPVSLDVRLVECDRLTSDVLGAWPENYDDGIQFDEYGNALSYDIARTHPGGDVYSRITDLGVDTYDARDVIHLFRKDRAEQNRGVCEYVSALPSIANYRRFVLATLRAAETAASFAGMLKSQAGIDAEAAALGEDEWLDTVEIASGMMTTLPTGWDIAQLKAEHPTTTFAEFRRCMINETARCLNMPFNVAAADSASYNYASGRLDHQTYYRSIDVERHQWEVECLLPIFEWWYEEATLVEGLLPRGLPPVDQIDIAWHWDGREHVDPVKEANAQKIRLENGTTTLLDEWAKQGQDGQVKLRQRIAEQAEEKALREEFGLSAPQPVAVGVIEDEEGDDGED